MKKFIIAFVVFFIANLACKKIGETPLCACSPVEPPFLSLILKNATGDDLLSATTTGFYTQNQIQLYYKDATGTTKQINFGVRPPFFYGTDKFNFNQLFSSEIVSLAKSGYTVFYLKLGDQQPSELSFQINQEMKIDKLMIDQKEAAKETKFSSGNFFYYVK